MSQSRLLDVDPSDTGYRRRAGRRPSGLTPGTTTTVSFSREERYLAERLAALDSTTLSDVLRQALRNYAGERGITPLSTEEDA